MSGPEEGPRELAFQLDRKDLFDTFRVMAGNRPLRKAAIPLLAGFVFLGHSLDGNYVKGLVWALGVGLLYWGFSLVMIFLSVFASSNETLLVPQRIRIFRDRMCVFSEHSREEFMRPPPSRVRAADRHVLIPMGRNSLVFMRRSFPEPGDYEALTDWLLGKGCSF